MADFAVSMLIFLLVFIILIIAVGISIVIGKDKNAEDNHVALFLIAALMGGIPVFFLWMGFKLLQFILALLAVYIFFYWLTTNFDRLINDILNKEKTRIILDRSATQIFLEITGISKF